MNRKPYPGLLYPYKAPLLPAPEKVEDTFQESQEFDCQRCGMIGGVKVGYDRRDVVEGYDELISKRCKNCGRMHVVRLKANRHTGVSGYAVAEKYIPEDL